MYQNNHDSDARSKIMPMAVNASSAEGLLDMVVDTPRRRLYIANSGLNRVEVFDMASQKFMTPIKVGQLPHSLALGMDGVTLYVANSGGENISVVDLTQMQQTALIRFPPLPFNSNIALITPNLIASGLQGPQVVMRRRQLVAYRGEIQLLPRALNTSVFGTAKTVPGPGQTMASTPGGEFIFLLAGNGNGYLYDSSIDDWIAERQLFTTNANTSTLPLVQGYYGPIAAGPQGQYFLANGIIYNQSLTEIGAVPTPAQVGVVTGGAATPARGGTTTSTNPTPIAGVADAGGARFIRFSQPNAATTTAALPVGFTAPGGGGGGGAGITFPGGGGGAGAGAGFGGGGAATSSTSASVQPPITGPTIEVVDVLSGNTMGTGIALEGPLAKVTGNQTQRIRGRTVAMDPNGSTAYAITTSGLSIVPLAPILPTDRPSVNPNGVVSTANYLNNIAPGSLVSIFGNNMGSDSSAPSGQALPTLMGGTCVTLNNAPMPLIVTSNKQINVQVPVELAAGSYPLYVRSIDKQAASAATVVKVVKVAPAVFTDGSGHAAIYHADGSLVTKDKPTGRDEKLTMFASGLGVTKGGKVTSGMPAPSSPLAVTDAVQVYFGSPSYSQAPIIVNWSGLVPGMIGVYQINLTVPGNHIKGDAIPVTIKIDGVSSPSTGPAPPVTWAN